jgi:beta-lactamase regulating signal transducer with metallopeptidase domain
MIFSHGNYCYLLDLEAPIAFTYGYINGKVILTRGLIKALDENELKAVLLHEKGHVIAKHNLKKLLYSLLLSPFVFFNLFKKFYNFSIEYMEIEADKYALDSGISQDILCRAILKVKSLSMSSYLSYFGVIERVENIYSDSAKEYINKEIKKIALYLIVPWIILIVNLFSARNACIVNPEIMNKKIVNKKLICP